MTQTSPHNQIQKLGIIAGRGELPARLLAVCDQKKIEVFIVAFAGQTDPSILEGRAHVISRIGAAGQIIKTLQNHNIKDIVMIGGLRRPSLSELRPDSKTAGFFARVGLKALGDDGLLRAVRAELEKDGFTLHAIQEFAEELLTRPGILGKRKPSKDDKADIPRGIEILRQTAPLDIGQSIIIQQGIVLGLEAAEGTDDLIKRCYAYQRKGKGGVLVKLCKEGQDTSLDLPTIGPETVTLAAQNGLQGIVIEAGRSLMLDAEETIQRADKEGLFLWGVTKDGALL